MRLRSFFGLRRFRGPFVELSWSERCDVICDDMDAFAEVKLCGDYKMEFSGTACMDLIGIDLKTMAECEDTRQ